MEEHKDPKEGFSFLQETIKEDKNQKRRLPKKIFTIAILGVVFGMTASVSFVVIKPWMESIFEEKEVVSIPSDEEMAAEEDSAKEELKAEVTEEVKEAVTEEVTEEIKQEIIDASENNELAITDYEKIYEQLYEVAQGALQSVVTVQAEYNAEQEAEEVLQSLQDGTVVDTKSVTGLVVAKTSTEVLILTPSTALEDAEKITVKMSDGTEVLATIKEEELILGYAVLSVSNAVISPMEIEVATLGNSLIVKQGEMTIAVGNQFDYEDGIGYGVISSTKNQLNLIDGSYTLISTDIPVAVGGTGVLINTSGEVIGLINTDLTDETAVDALAISPLKAIIEALSNGEEVPYVGIKSIEITEEIAEQQTMPLGLYVQEIEIDSPAMAAGIRSGDIITSMNGVTIETINSYQNSLLKLDAGDIIIICIQRKGLDGYVEMELEVTIGNRE